MWSDLREFAWAHAAGVLAKIPITLAALDRVAVAASKITGARAHFSAAGNVAYVSFPSSDLLPPFDAELRAFGLSGIVLRGSAAPMRIATVPPPLAGCPAASEASPLLQHLVRSAAPACRRSGHQRHLFLHLHARRPAPAPRCSANPNHQIQFFPNPTDTAWHRWIHQATQRSNPERRRSPAERIDTRCRYGVSIRRRC